MPLRLPWVQSWLDTPDDGCVRPDHLGHPTDVLRVKHARRGWTWTCSRLLPPRGDGIPWGILKDGAAPTKLEAQEAAERCYFGDPSPAADRQ